MYALDREEEKRYSSAITLYMYGLMCVTFGPPWPTTLADHPGRPPWPTALADRPGRPPWPTALADRPETI